jgi:hypothetical protein
MNKHFLINDADNSVNCVSDQPHPQFMIHEGLSVHELPIDHLPENTNLIDCHYDPDTNSIIPNKMGFTRISAAQFNDLEAQQRLMSAAAEQAQKEKIDLVFNHLLTLYPDDPVLKEIISDGIITQDELQQIEQMLNS